MATRSLKGVKSEVDFLAAIHALNYEGRACSKVRLAEMMGWSKRTVERVVSKLVADGVLTRTGGKGRQPAHYQFTGVYHGRFGVVIYVHPEKPAVLIIQGEGFQREYEIFKSPD